MAENTTSGFAYPAELKPLLERAHAGDPATVPELRAALQRFPQLATQVYHLAGQVEAGFLGLVAGTNLMAQEAVRAQLAARKEELGLAQATPLEKLLIERLVLCWLQTMEADLHVADKLRKGDYTFEALACAQKRQQQAHQRLLSSAKTLAVVRKLLRPAPSPVEVATRLAGRGEVPAAVQARMDTVCVEN
jgi:hypothetical protein